MRSPFLLIIIFFLSFTTSIFASLGYAESDNDVEIKVISERKLVASTLDFTLSINYHNQDLYNEENFLSFHFYDEEDKVLHWEGERIPFKIDSGGGTKVSFSLNLNDYPNVKGLKNSYLQFDIIDEKNAYWFSTNDEIRFFADRISYDKGFLTQNVVTIKSAITDKPAIFLVNSVCLTIFIFFFFKLKKSASNL